MSRLASPAESWHEASRLLPSEEELKRMATGMTDTLGVAWMDQLDAAVDEGAKLTERIVRDARLAGSRTDHEAYSSARTSLWLLAEIEGRVEFSCEHFDQSRPDLWMLSLTSCSVGCRRCAPDAIGVDAHPGVCDWCREPTTLFRDFLMQLGPYSVTGNLCDRCAEELNEVLGQ